MMRDTLSNAMKEALKAKGIDASVVSMPCMEDFLAQSAEKQNAVLPLSVRRRVAVEAGATMPWYRFTGLDGKVLGLDHFGASAPFKVLAEKFGLTAASIAERTKAKFSL